jgi:integrase
MYKRGDVWWTSFRHNGKKVQKSLKTSNKRLAQAIEAKITAEINGKNFSKKRSSQKTATVKVKAQAKKENFMTVKDLIDKYITEHSQPTKAEASYKDDIYFSKRILQHFGKTSIEKVSPKQIAEFIKKRRQDGVKDVTINHELRLLRHAYNMAIKYWELIDRSPFDKINIPRGDVKRVRYLSESEEIRLFEALPNWMVPIVIIARETGLRLSNIAELQWSQVNLFNKSITIETTKNGDPLGLPITDNVYNVLKELNKVRRLDSDYIFGKDGKPYRRWWISESFRKARRQAKIENFRFHDLRHDFCSRLVQRGVDLYAVAALAGHRDIKTTQRYAHLNVERLRSAVSVLNSN